MKKQYITPVCITVSVCTPNLLTVSQNEYSNNQGHIHFESDMVNAEDAD